ncbi:trehalose-phosphatase-domain-containing protein [Zychaea mexicana]|uniref:trehalose-phosphatase-domain-containing protein n=1 Tax=Zychaea mexicana TaxID=64656 RepID=UPI0022FE3C18|nr:trehalose-phosphatase-domain-containing protein [Zychaea mexicana]KAI9490923.1 trehalose-phosphatase-domain-containing protein [Zychaea mexicana]
MPSILHAISTPNGEQLSFQPTIELPPSPPHSPPKHHFVHPGLLSLPTTQQRVNPTMWLPAWHAVHDAMTTWKEHDHDIIHIDDASTPAFITNILDPWFQYNSLPRQQKVNENEWNEFVEFNEKYADLIVNRYRSHHDIIWVHDYHLILLPSMLRRKLPQATIGFTIYACCPNLDKLEGYGRALQRSMSAADLIGVQSELDMPVLSAASATAAATPITTTSTATTLLTPTVHLKTPSFAAQERSRDIRRLFKGKRIVLCQDTEPAGVLKTVAAMEHYLSTHNKENTIFIHICTRASIPRPLDSIPDLVRQINQLYGTPESVPIHFYHQDMDTDEYDALLLAADAALIMGMHPHASIAAQTYIARQQQSLSNTTPSLIVSHGSPLQGQHITADQSSPSALAAALESALDSDKQQPQQQHAVSKQQKPKFLETLSKKRQQQQKLTAKLNPTQVGEACRNARRRLFLFDYDGTLSPIVANPDDAKPTRALLRYLQALCNDPRNVVWIVSGRDQATLDSWISSTVHGIGLSAEHGSFMKLPGESSWVDMLAQADMSWKSRALAIFESYTARTPGTVVEQKKSSITWHYRNAHDADLALKQCEACFEELQKIPGGGVDIMRGKMNLEVRSLLVNKGNVVQRIQQSVGADFVLCAGDDRTDEDMFRALEDEPAYCVLIGPQDKETDAKYCAETSEQFVSCVGQLANVSSTHSAL